MNAYQSIMNNLSLSEDAKRNISKILQSEWERERAQNSFSRRAKIGAAIAMASVVAICAITIPFGLHHFENPNGRLKFYVIGLNSTFSDDNGTFCWREIALSKTILNGDTLYESSRAGFLIVKAEFDFASYRLEECGIMLYGRLGPYPRQGYFYRINYYQRENGEYWCDIQNDGDLNLEITQALSTDLNIFEEPQEVRGTAYLCFEIDSTIVDYLTYLHELELNNEEPRSYQDVDITLNNIWKDEKCCLTKIGCSFAEVNFFDSYVI